MSAETQRNAYPLMLAASMNSETLKRHALTHLPLNVWTQVEQAIYNGKKLYYSTFLDGSGWDILSF